MREFEELQKTNPEAAMEKLEELEKARITERMTLKHRNTTKWAKMQAARAKYNRASREVLADQLKISRDLTVKRIESSDDEEEDEPTTSMPVLVKTSAENPTQTLINIRNHLNLGGTVKFDMKGTKTKLEELEEEDDDDVEQRNLIAEAFEDDDVITEFQRKKQEEIDKEKPADVDLCLPGWGEWGGSGIKMSARKRKRFTKKGKPAPPRKDSKLPHVILNSEANLKLKDHQVRELPFPFTRVKEFEKMVRAPVGRTWIPEQSVKSLVAPKVITRLGAVIQPITEDMLANKPENSKRLKLAGGLTMSQRKQRS
jgi:U3 small nucleolar RNA-associated protein 14